MHGGDRGVQERERIACDHHDEKAPAGQHKIEEREGYIVVLLAHLPPNLIRDPVQHLGPYQIGQGNHEPLQHREEKDFFFLEDQPEGLTKLGEEHRKIVRRNDLGLLPGTWVEKIADSAAPYR